MEHPQYRTNDHVQSSLPKIYPTTSNSPSDGKTKEYLYKYPPRNRPQYAMIQCRWTIPPAGRSVDDCRYQHNCCFGHEEDRYFDDPWRVQRFIEGFNVEFWEAKVSKDGSKSWKEKREELLSVAAQINKRGIKGGHQRLIAMAAKAKNHVFGDNTVSYDQGSLGSKGLRSGIPLVEIKPVRWLRSDHDAQFLPFKEHLRQQQKLQKMFEQQQQSEQQSNHPQKTNEPEFTFPAKKSRIVNSRTASPGTISIDSYLSGYQPQQPHQSNYQDPFFQNLQVPSGGEWGYYGRPHSDPALAKDGEDGFHCYMPMSGSSTPPSVGSDVSWLGYSPVRNSQD